MRIKVVIPVYKKELSIEEKRSLKQCMTILNNYEFVFVTHNDLDKDQYNLIANETNTNYQFEYFERQYFESVQSYNRLLLSRNFYLRFQKYDYILIYQLDAFVFKDELMYWCEMGFDYIGAPWFTRWGNRLYKVGNGGVSLRKVSTFLERFDRLLSFPVFPFYVKNIRKKKIFSMCIKTIKIFFLLLFSKKTVEYYLLNLTDECINEDTFWADALDNTSLKLNKPDAITAAHFCMEKFPSYLYSLTGEKLPFSCHAYEKYEYEKFWRKIIYQL